MHMEIVNNSRMCGTTMMDGHFNPLYKKYRSRFLLYSAICFEFCDGVHDNNTGKAQISI